MQVWLFAFFKSCENEEEPFTHLTYSCPTLDTTLDFPLGPPVSSLSTLIHSGTQQQFINNTEAYQWERSLNFSWRIRVKVLPFQTRNRPD